MKPPAPDPLEAHVAGVLRRLDLLGARLAVALSGGVDSMVLLHVLHAIAARHRLRLSALHVDHGISPDSARWAQHCAVACDALGIALRTVRVEVPRDTGSGLEAAARAARYAAFAGLDVDALALAHQLDDQAETVLLQLLRGAGAQGLAGMPEARPLPGSDVLLVRPLLEIARADVEDYARRTGLQWVQDASNLCTDFDRNYLRHEVLPRLAARFPGYRQTLLRASRNLADVAEVAQEMARLDAATAASAEALRVVALRALPRVRQINLLRWFLQQQRVRPPPRERLEEALAQLLVAAPDRVPLVRLGALALRRHRGLIQVAPADAPVSAWSMVWRGEPELALPDGYGVLRLRTVQGQGLDAQRLAGGTLSVSPRRGGERLQLSPRRPRRSLKDLLREAGLPPWVRERLPLLFFDGVLAWVPGIGGDHHLAAAPGAAGVLPEWVAPES